jgi:8-oxo-dGTP pyrophosphatase MutT (NUDIX family)
MSFLFSDALRQRIARHLAGFPRRSIAEPGLRRAAVVLVVARTGAEHVALADDACILLTKRPENLRRHAGQFALPGGRLDEGETAEAAALRELHEELRLELDPAAILGTLDDYATRSGFVITPIVAWGGAAEDLTPDPVEVARVLRIPFRDLDSPDIPHLDPQGEGAPPVLSAPLATLGHKVYAPTAAMLYQFREVALHGRETRVAHFDQPRFAWK